jgi:CheY-like chemotaxis protein
LRASGRDWDHRREAEEIGQSGQADPDRRRRIEHALPAQDHPREPGYEVIEAHHGAAALERVRESRPNLVVTDLMMPVMNGRDLVGRLRADPETASIPILLITANPHAAVAAVDAIVGKPFDPEAVVETARSLAGSGG